MLFLSNISNASHDPCAKGVTIEYVGVGQGKKSHKECPDHGACIKFGYSTKEGDDISHSYVWYRYNLNDNDGARFYNSLVEAMFNRDVLDLIPNHKNDCSAIKEFRKTNY